MNIQLSRSLPSTLGIDMARPIALEGFIGLGQVYLLRAKTWAPHRDLSPNVVLLL